MTTRTTIRPSTAAAGSARTSVAGIHVFLTDAIALDLTVRDYMFSDNPSGADFDANLYVNDSDSRFLHHLFMGAGVSIMLPFKVKRTN
jgi:hypothetical protein